MNTEDFDNTPQPFQWIRKADVDAYKNFQLEQVIAFLRSAFWGKYATMNIENLDLSQALQIATIEKDDPVFCSVHFKAPEYGILCKVMGLDHRDKTDFQLIEEAFSILNETYRC